MSVTSGSSSRAIGRYEYDCFGGRRWRTPFSVGLHDGEASSKNTSVRCEFLQRSSSEEQAKQLDNIAEAVILLVEQLMEQMRVA